MKYYSTKTYGHSVGLSCCFRQWRANHSHCQYLHGYALKVTLVFGANSLDARNWVMDFGGLKDVKKFLEKTFDHKTVVAADDPMLPVFMDMENNGLIQITQLPNVGCEAFAEYIFHWVTNWMQKNFAPWGDGPQLLSVEVAEHEGNSAIYFEGGK